MRLPLLSAFTERTRAEPVANQLDALLEEISHHGRTTLSQLNDGRWWCRVEMNTAGFAGAKFEISSELLPTRIAAAEQCHARIRAAAGRAHGATP